MMQPNRNLHFFVTHGFNLQGAPLWSAKKEASPSATAPDPQELWQPESLPSSTSTTIRDVEDKIYAVLMSSKFKIRLKAILGAQTPLWKSSMRRIVPRTRGSIGRYGRSNTTESWVMGRDFLSPVPEASMWEQWHSGNSKERLSKSNMFKWHSNDKWLKSSCQLESIS